MRSLWRNSMDLECAEEFVGASFKCVLGTRK